MPCLAPILAVGFLATVPYPYEKTPTNSPVIELTSCATGPGVTATLAPDAGLAGFQVRYGFAYDFDNDVQLGLAPEVGMSHDFTEPGYRELPMRTQFGVGGSAWVRLTNYLYIIVKYWHLSNAGLDNKERRPNVGLDELALMLGTPIEGIWEWLSQVWNRQNEEG